MHLRDTFPDTESLRRCCTETVDTSLIQFWYQIAVMNFVCLYSSKPVSDAFSLGLSTLLILANSIVEDIASHYYNWLCFGLTVEGQTYGGDYLLESTL